MEAKLKFNSNPIPWFLVLRVIGVVFLWFSFGKFIGLLGGALLYFFPWFQPGKLFIGFLLWVLFGVFLPPDFVGAVWLGCFLLTLLSLKDNLLPYPRLVYQVLLLLMAALGFYYWFLWAGGNVLFSILPLAVGLGLFVSIVVWHFLGYESPNSQAEMLTERVLVSGIVGFLVAQVNLVSLLVPLNPALQGGLLFLTFAALLQSADDYIFGRREARFVFRSAGIFFLGLLIIVLANDWQL